MRKYRSIKSKKKRKSIPLASMLALPYHCPMSIRHAILGFLSWKSFTGYELKHRFSDALSFHWSGNNNQIYGALIELHAQGLVSIEVLQQEKRPAKKLYTITEQGRLELQTWLESEPELPVLRSDFTTRLAWAAGLEYASRKHLIDRYAQSLEAHILMCEERGRRNPEQPARSDLEKALWAAADRHSLEFYRAELKWLGEIHKILESDAVAGNTDLNP